MPTYAIAIADRQTAVRIDRGRLAALARGVLRRERVAAAEISVAIVDDAEIHAVNRRFLKHDCPTDVISFLFEQPVPAAVRHGADPAVRRGTGRTLDGEVVISAETARRNARRLRTSCRHELALYLVHGLLHLCGYDDLSPDEKRLMRAREAEALGRRSARRRP